MPTAAPHPINEDLAKLRCRRNFKRRLSPRSLTRMARACRSDEDRADVVRSLIHSANVTADAPPYDPERVRAGGWSMALGAILAGLGGVIAWTTGANPANDLVGLLTQIGAVALVLFGVFMLSVGHEQRFGEHLPRHLDRGDIDSSHRLLNVTHESQRAGSSALAGRVASAFIIADAAILLFLVTPLLLPSALPIWHLIIVAVGALVIGKLSGHAADSVAKSIRRGQLLAYHDTKASADGPEARATAQALRTYFDAAVGGVWPVSPSLWTRYASALPGFAFLVTVTTVLLAMRLMLGNSEADWLPVVLVAFLVFGTLAVAIGLKARNECLVPEVTRAKRIAERFRSGEQFDREMRADREGVQMMLIEARKVLRSAAMPRRHDVATRVPSYELLGAGFVADPGAPPPVVRIGSPFSSTHSTASRGAGGSLGRPSDRHAAHRAAGFRPNPDAKRR